jgi:hypothetical protein
LSAVFDLDVANRKSIHASWSVRDRSKPPTQKSTSKAADKPALSEVEGSVRPTQANY